MKSRSNRLLIIGRTVFWRFWYISLPIVALVTAFIISTFSSPVRLMPAPIKFNYQEATLFQDKNSASTDTAIPIFYATNRTPLIDVDNPTYTFIRDEALRFGTASVTIGDGDLTWAEVRQLSSQSDTSTIRPELNLESIHPMAEFNLSQPDTITPETQAFFDQLQQAVDQSGTQELIVYVHGFNNPVWKGFAQAAQLHHFSERNVVVLAFSWPSAGSMLSYATDVRAARESAPAFGELIRLIAQHTTIQHIDILAFSAGARIASQGLANLYAHTPNPSQDQYRLGQIHYAAPDEDLDRFITDLSSYIHYVNRVSIGANMSDSALRWAQRHQGVSRAGRPDLNDLDADQAHFLLNAAQTLNFDVIKIQPTIIPSLDQSSHSFWYDNPWVSTDVLVQFRWQRPPEARGLEERLADNGLKVWIFPEDYEQRISKTLEVINQP